MLQVEKKRASWSRSKTGRMREIASDGEGKSVDQGGRHSNEERDCSKTEKREQVGVGVKQG